MRTLVSTLLVGVCLVGSPALAQQHPWVPSCVYAGSCMFPGNVRNGDLPARAYGHVRTGHRWRTGKSGSGEL
jgi:hypothetical protein